jgi:formylglycine-generating enzyme
MRSLASLWVVFGCSVFAQASVVIETVPVGNPGNPADTRYCTPGYGAVGYAYDVGKYEVTAGQYCAFLNAVAARDTYGLFSAGMADISDYAGCNIQRSGSPGCYTYSVAADWADRPVNWVSWGDAARFANWMHNGQPTGAQGLNTTEDGSFYLNGATSLDPLMAVTRRANATWVIPSEDEWYKAAYHKNDGLTGSYWDYPTSSDDQPSNDVIDPDPGSNANFPSAHTGTYHLTIGSPYYRTEAGEFENSASPYGTFDQAGNVREWTETEAAGTCRVKRGGSWGWRDVYMRASTREFYVPMEADADIGFRLALVPEPSSVALIFIGLAMLRRR